jgi:hypothetical protein
MHRLTTPIASPIVSELQVSAGGLTQAASWVLLISTVLPLCPSKLFAVQPFMQPFVQPPRSVMPTAAYTCRGYSSRTPSGTHEARRQVCQMLEKRVWVWKWNDN